MEEWWVQITVNQLSFLCTIFPSLSALFLTMADKEAPAIAATAAASEACKQAGRDY